MRTTSCHLMFSSMLLAFSATASNENFTINSNNELQLLSADEYRLWVYVGTPLTPNDMNNGKAAFPEFHNVYIDPESFAHYEKTGEFPDGTILVKELVSVGPKAAVSGQGYFQGEFIGLEATIKSKNYFPNEPGHWAYFSFTSPESRKLNPMAKAFSTESCNTCHAAAAQDDFVFTQYYPVLRDHKGKKK
ncbi:cytochrome P460 family protein [Photobacterium galatheae]|uniref:cytochrome P460 family protein n=1 Tax=Photobacterium galatheae TaxID=1654360 RepID=UPI00202CB3BC|nr:cytochrome P460 family protein [Photobacterium galatheae]